MIVKFNNNEDYELIKKILKITNITEEKLEKVEYNIKNKRFDITIYYEKELTEEDKKLKEKEIESLKASIAKRKGLLSNDNFVSKAPINLVEQEKAKLEEEEEKLKNLENN